MLSSKERVFKIVDGNNANEIQTKEVFERTVPNFEAYVKDGSLFLSESSSATPEHEIRRTTCSQSTSTLTREVRRNNTTISKFSSESPEKYSSASKEEKSLKQTTQTEGHVTESHFSSTNENTDLSDVDCKHVKVTTHLKVVETKRTQSENIINRHQKVTEFPQQIHTYENVHKNDVLHVPLEPESETVQNKFLKIHDNRINYYNNEISEQQEGSTHGVMIRAVKKRKTIIKKIQIINGQQTVVEEVIHQPERYFEADLNTEFMENVEKHEDNTQTETNSSANRDNFNKDFPPIYFETRSKYSTDEQISFTNLEMEAPNLSTVPDGKLESECIETPFPPVGSQIQPDTENLPSTIDTPAFWKKEVYDGCCQEVGPSMIENLKLEPKCIPEYSSDSELNYDRAPIFNKASVFNKTEQAEESTVWSETYYNNLSHSNMASNQADSTSSISEQENMSNVHLSVPIYQLASSSAHSKDIYENWPRLHVEDNTELLISSSASWTRMFPNNYYPKTFGVLNASSYDNVSEMWEVDKDNILLENIPSEQRRYILPFELQRLYVSDLHLPSKAIVSDVSKVAPTHIINRSIFVNAERNEKNYAGDESDQKDYKMLENLPGAVKTTKVVNLSSDDIANDSNICNNDIGLCSQLYLSPRPKEVLLNMSYSDIVACRGESSFDSICKTQLHDSFKVIPDKIELPEYSLSKFNLVRQQFEPGHSNTSTPLNLSPIKSPRYQSAYAFAKGELLGEPNIFVVNNEEFTRTVDSSHLNPENREQTSRDMSLNLEEQEIIAGSEDLRNKNADFSVQSVHMGDTQSLSIQNACAPGQEGDKTKLLTAGTQSEVIDSHHGIEKHISEFSPMMSEALVLESKVDPTNISSQVTQTTHSYVSQTADNDSFSLSDTQMTSYGLNDENKKEGSLTSNLAQKLYEVDRFSPEANNETFAEVFEHDDRFVNESNSQLHVDEFKEQSELLDPEDDIPTEKYEFNDAYKHLSTIVEEVSYITEGSYETSETSDNMLFNEHLSHETSERDMIVSVENISEHIGKDLEAKRDNGTSKSKKVFDVPKIDEINMPETMKHIREPAEILAPSSEEEDRTINSNISLSTNADSSATDEHRKSSILGHKETDVEHGECQRIETLESVAIYPTVYAEFSGDSLSEDKFNPMDTALPIPPEHLVSSDVVYDTTCYYTRDDSCPEEMQETVLQSSEDLSASLQEVTAGEVDYETVPYFEDAMKGKTVDRTKDSVESMPATLYSIPSSSEDNSSDNNHETPIRKVLDNESLTASDVEKNSPNLKSVAPTSSSLNIDVVAKSTCDTEEAVSSTSATKEPIMENESYGNIPSTKRSQRQTILTNMETGALDVELFNNKTAISKQKDFDEKTSEKVALQADIGDVSDSEVTSCHDNSETNTILMHTVPCDDNNVTSYDHLTSANDGDDADAAMIFDSKHEIKVTSSFNEKENLEALVQTISNIDTSFSEIPQGSLSTLDDCKNEYQLAESSCDTPKENMTTDPVACVTGNVVEDISKIPKESLYDANVSISLDTRITEEIIIDTPTHSASTAVQKSTIIDTINIPYSNSDGEDDFIAVSETEKSDNKVTQSKTELISKNSVVRSGVFREVSEESIQLPKQTQYGSPEISEDTVKLPEQTGPSNHDFSSVSSNIDVEADGIILVSSDTVRASDEEIMQDISRTKFTTSSPETNESFSSTKDHETDMLLAAEQLRDPTMEFKYDRAADGTTIQTIKNIDNRVAEEDFSAKVRDQRSSESEDSSIERRENAIQGIELYVSEVPTKTSSSYDVVETYEISAAVVSSSNATLTQNFTETIDSMQVSPFVHQVEDTIKSNDICPTVDAKDIKLGDSETFAGIREADTQEIMFDDTHAHAMDPTNQLSNISSASQENENLMDQALLVSQICDFSKQPKLEKGRNEISKTAVISCREDEVQMTPTVKEKTGSESPDVVSLSSNDSIHIPISDARPEFSNEKKIIETHPEDKKNYSVDHVTLNAPVTESNICKDSISVSEETTPIPGDSTCDTMSSNKLVQTVVDWPDSVSSQEGLPENAELESDFEFISNSEVEFSECKQLADDLPKFTDSSSLHLKFGEGKITEVQNEATARSNMTKENSENEDIAPCKVQFAESTPTKLGESSGVQDLSTSLEHNMQAQKGDEIIDPEINEQPKKKKRKRKTKHGKIVKTEGISNLQDSCKETSCFESAVEDINIENEATLIKELSTTELVVSQGESFDNRQSEILKETLNTSGLEGRSTSEIKNETELSMLDNVDEIRGVLEKPKHSDNYEETHLDQKNSEDSQFVPATSLHDVQTSIGEPDLSEFEIISNVTQLEQHSLDNDTSIVTTLPETSTVENSSKINQNDNDVTQTSRIEYLMQDVQNIQTPQHISHQDHQTSAKVENSSDRNRKSQNKKKRKKKTKSAATNDDDGEDADMEKKVDVGSEKKADLNTRFSDSLNITNDSMFTNKEASVSTCSEESMDHAKFAFTDSKQSKKIDSIEKESTPADNNDVEVDDVCVTKPSTYPKQTVESVAVTKFCVETPSSKKTKRKKGKKSKEHSISTTQDFDPQVCPPTDQLVVNTEGNREVGRIEISDLTKEDTNTDLSRTTHLVTKSHAEDLTKDELKGSPPFKSSDIEIGNKSGTAVGDFVSTEALVIDSKDCVNDEIINATVIEGKIKVPFSEDSAVIMDPKVINQQASDLSSCTKLSPHNESRPLVGKVDILQQKVSSDQDRSPAIHQNEGGGTCEMFASDTEFFENISENYSSEISNVSGKDPKLLESLIANVPAEIKPPAYVSLSEDRNIIPFPNFPKGSDAYQTVVESDLSLKSKHSLHQDREGMEVHSVTSPLTFDGSIPSQGDLNAVQDMDDNKDGKIPKILASEDLPMEFSSNIAPLSTQILYCEGKENDPNKVLQQKSSDELITNEFPPHEKSAVAEPDWKEKCDSNNYFSCIPIADSGKGFPVFQDLVFEQPESYQDIQNKGQRYISVDRPVDLVVPETETVPESTEFTGTGKIQSSSIEKLKDNDGSNLKDQPKNSPSNLGSISMESDSNPIPLDVLDGQVVLDIYEKEIPQVCKVSSNMDTLTYASAVSSSGDVKSSEPVSGKICSSVNNPFEDQVSSDLIGSVTDQHDSEFCSVIPNQSLGEVCDTKEPLETSESNLPIPSTSEAFQETDEATPSAQSTASPSFPDIYSSVGLPLEFSSDIRNPTNLSEQNLSIDLKTQNRLSGVGEVTVQEYIENQFQTIEISMAAEPNWSEQSNSTDTSPDSDSLSAGGIDFPVYPEFSSAEHIADQKEASEDVSNISSEVKEESMNVPCNFNATKINNSSTQSKEIATSIQKEDSFLKHPFETTETILCFDSHSKELVSLQNEDDEFSSPSLKVVKITEHTETVNERVPAFAESQQYIAPNQLSLSIEETSENSSVNQLMDSYDLDQCPDQLASNKVEVSSLGSNNIEDTVDSSNYKEQSVESESVVIREDQPDTLFNTAKPILPIVTTPDAYISGKDFAVSSQNQHSENTMPFTPKEEKNYDESENNDRSCENKTEICLGNFKIQDKHGSEVSQGLKDNVVHTEDIRGSRERKTNIEDTTDPPVPHGELDEPDNYSTDIGTPIERSIYTDTHDSICLDNKLHQQISHTISETEPKEPLRTASGYRTKTAVDFPPYSENSKSDDSVVLNDTEICISNETNKDGNHSKNLPEIKSVIKCETKSSVESTTDEDETSEDPKTNQHVTSESYRKEVQSSGINFSATNDEHIIEYPVPHDRLSAPDNFDSNIGPLPILSCTQISDDSIRKDTDPYQQISLMSSETDSKEPPVYTSTANDDNVCDFPAYRKESSTEKYMPFLESGTLGDIGEQKLPIKAEIDCTSESTVNIDETSRQQIDDQYKDSASFQHSILLETSSDTLLLDESRTGNIKVEESFKYPVPHGKAGAPDNFGSNIGPLPDLSGNQILSDSSCQDSGSYQQISDNFSQIHSKEPPMHYAQDHCQTVLDFPTYPEPLSTGENVTLHQSNIYISNQNDGIRSPVENIPGQLIEGETKSALELIEKSDAAVIPEFHDRSCHITDDDVGENTINVEVQYPVPQSKLSTPEDFETNIGPLPHWSIRNPSMGGSICEDFDSYKEISNKFSEMESKEPPIYTSLDNSPSAVEFPIFPTEGSTLPEREICISRDNDVTPEEINIAGYIADNISEPQYVIDNVFKPTNDIRDGLEEEIEDQFSATESCLAQIGSEHLSLTSRTEENVSEKEAKVKGSINHPVPHDELGSPESFESNIGPLPNFPIRSQLLGDFTLEDADSCQKISDKFLKTAFKAPPIYLPEDSNSSGFEFPNYPVQPMTSKRKVSENATNVEDCIDYPVPQDELGAPDRYKSEIEPVSGFSIRARSRKSICKDSELYEQISVDSAETESKQPPVYVSQGNSPTAVDFPTYPEKSTLTSIAMHESELGIADEFVEVGSSVENCEEKYTVKGHGHTEQEYETNTEIDNVVRLPEEAYETPGKEIDEKDNINKSIIAPISLEKSLTVENIPEDIPSIDRIEPPIPHGELGEPENYISLIETFTQLPIGTDTLNDSIDRNSESYQRISYNFIDTDAKEPPIYTSEDINLPAVNFPTYPEQSVAEASNILHPSKICISHDDDREPDFSGGQYKIKSDTGITARTEEVNEQASRLKSGDKSKIIIGITSHPRESRDNKDETSEYNSPHNILGAPDTFESDIGPVPDLPTHSQSLNEHICHNTECYQQISDEISETDAKEPPMYTSEDTTSSAVDFPTCWEQSSTEFISFPESKTSISEENKEDLSFMKNFVEPENIMKNRVGGGYPPSAHDAETSSHIKEKESIMSNVNDVIDHPIPLGEPAFPDEFESNIGPLPDLPVHNQVSDGAINQNQDEQIFDLFAQTGAKEPPAYVPQSNESVALDFPVYTEPETTQDSIILPESRMSVRDEKDFVTSSTMKYSNDELGTPITDSSMQGNRCMDQNIYEQDLIGPNTDSIKVSTVSIDDSSKLQIIHQNTNEFGKQQIPCESLSPVLKVKPVPDSLASQEMSPRGFPEILQTLEIPDTDIKLSGSPDDISNDRLEDSNYDYSVSLNDPNFPGVSKNANMPQEYSSHMKSTGSLLPQEKIFEMDTSHGENVCETGSELKSFKKSNSQEESDVKIKGPNYKDTGVSSIDSPVIYETKSQSDSNEEQGDTSEYVQEMEEQDVIDTSLGFTEVQPSAPPLDEVMLPECPHTSNVQISSIQQMSGEGDATLSSRFISEDSKCLIKNYGVNIVAPQTFGEQLLTRESDKTGNTLHPSHEIPKSKENISRNQTTEVSCIRSDETSISDVNYYPEEIIPSEYKPMQSTSVETDTVSDEAKKKSKKRRKRKTVHGTKSKESSFEETSPAKEVVETCPSEVLDKENKYVTVTGDYEPKQVTFTTDLSSWESSLPEYEEQHENSSAGIESKVCASTHSDTLRHSLKTGEQYSHNKHTKNERISKDCETYHQIGQHEISTDSSYLNRVNITQPQGMHDYQENVQSKEKEIQTTIYGSMQEMEFEMAFEDLQRDSSPIHQPLQSSSVESGSLHSKDLDSSWQATKEYLIPESSQISQTVEFADNSVEAVVLSTEKSRKLSNISISPKHDTKLTMKNIIEVETLDEINYIVDIIRSLSPGEDLQADSLSMLSLEKAIELLKLYEFAIESTSSNVDQETLDLFLRIIFTKITQIEYIIRTIRQRQTSDEHLEMLIEKWEILSCRLKQMASKQSSIDSFSSSQWKIYFEDMQSLNSSTNRDGSSSSGINVEECTIQRHMMYKILLQYILNYPQHISLANLEFNDLMKRQLNVCHQIEDKSEEMKSDPEGQLTPPFTPILSQCDLIMNSMDFNRIFVKDLQSLRNLLEKLQEMISSYYYLECVSPTDTTDNLSLNLTDKIHQLTRGRNAEWTWNIIQEDISNELEWLKVIKLKFEDLEDVSFRRKREIIKNIFMDCLKHSAALEQKVYISKHISGSIMVLEEWNQLNELYISIMNLREKLATTFIETELEWNSLGVDFDGKLNADVLWNRAGTLKKRLQCIEIDITGENLVSNLKDIMDIDAKIVELEALIDFFVAHSHMGDKQLEMDDNSVIELKDQCNILVESLLTKKQDFIYLLQGKQINSKDLLDELLHQSNTISQFLTGEQAYQANKLVTLDKQSIFIQDTLEALNIKDEAQLTPIMSTIKQIRSDNQLAAISHCPKNIINKCQDLASRNHSWKSIIEGLESDQSVIFIEKYVQEVLQQLERKYEELDEAVAESSSDWVELTPLRLDNLKSISQNIHRRQIAWEEHWNLHQNNMTSFDLTLIETEIVISKSYEWVDIYKYEKYVKRLRKLKANLEMEVDGVKSSSDPLALVRANRAVQLTSILNEMLKKEEETLSVWFEMYKNSTTWKQELRSFVNSMEEHLCLGTPIANSDLEFLPTMDIQVPEHCISVKRLHQDIQPIVQLKSEIEQHEIVVPQEYHLLDLREAFKKSLIAYSSCGFDNKDLMCQISEVLGTKATEMQTVLPSDFWGSMTKLAYDKMNNLPETVISSTQLDDNIDKWEQYLLKVECEQSNALPHVYEKLRHFNYLLTSHYHMVSLHLMILKRLSHNHQGNTKLNSHIKRTETLVQQLCTTKSRTGTILKLYYLHQLKAKQIITLLWYLKLQCLYCWKYHHKKDTAVTIGNILQQLQLVQAELSKLQQLNDNIRHYYQTSQCLVDIGLPSKLDGLISNISALLRDTSDCVDVGISNWAQFNNIYEQLQRDIEESLDLLRANSPQSSTVSPISGRALCNLSELEAPAVRLLKSCNEGEIEWLKTSVFYLRQYHNLHKSYGQFLQEEHSKQLFKYFLSKLETIVSWTTTVECMCKIHSTSTVSSLTTEVQSYFLPKTYHYKEVTSFISQESSKCVSNLTKKQQKELMKMLPVTEKAVEKTLQHLQALEQKLTKISFDIDNAKLAVSEISLWLKLMEAATSGTLNLPSISNYDKVVEKEDKLLAEFNSQSTIIYSVLEACRRIVSSCTEFKSCHDIKHLAKSEILLEQRYNNIKRSCEIRKKALQKVGKNYQILLQLIKKLQIWLTSMETNVSTVETKIELLQYSTLNTQRKQMEKYQKQSADHYAQIEELNTNYRSFGQSDIVLIGEDESLSESIRIINSRYHELDRTLFAMTRRLELSMSFKSNIDTFKNGLCKKINKAIGKQQLSISLLDSDIVSELNEFKTMLKTFYQRSSPVDCAAYEILLEEYNDVLCDVYQKSEPEMYLQISTRETEFKEALSDAENKLRILEVILESEENSADDSSSRCYELTKQLASCRCAVDFLESFAKQDNSNNTQSRIQQTIETLLHLTTIVNARMELLQSNQTKFGTDCPMCSERNWAQFQNDMWRLEQWLQHSEALQSELKNPPKEIDALNESCVLHKEFLLNMDAHKPINCSLNIIGNHLVDHLQDKQKARLIQQQLKTMNERWEMISTETKIWQSKLRQCLMNNHKFHQLLTSLVEWEESINDHLDLIQISQSTENTIHLLIELKNDIEMHEPRIINLYRMVKTLLVGIEDEYWSSTLETLYLLDDKLRVLQNRCRQQSIELYNIITRNPNSSPYLRELCVESLLSRSSSTSELAVYEWQSPSTDDSALSNIKRFCSRVIRTALPIQAAMLILLGIAYLVPTSEEDYSCIMSNSFARSLNPMLRHDGLPPF